MNPLLPTTAPTTLSLPLNQLCTHCDRLSKSVNDSRQTEKEKILYEQTLWNEVKKIKSSSDDSVFLYLTGFYLTILYHCTNDLQQNNDQFQYNVLIRLGDLNRYMNRPEVAEYHYCTARNLFPRFGHAYNQLGLLTKPTNCYKCCYYYARAARSSEKPLNTIADSNLRIAVSRYNCEILGLVLDDQIHETSLRGETQIEKLPSRPFDWFYVMVVAIYADNIAPVAKQFVVYFKENLCTETLNLINDRTKLTTICCSLGSYLMLATLDILLDWIRHGSQGKSMGATLSNDIRRVKLSLQKIILTISRTSYKSNRNTLCQALNNIPNPNANQVNAYDKNHDSSSFMKNPIQPRSSPDYDLNDSTNTNVSMKSGSSSGCSMLRVALPHDYVLSGFSPLDKVHTNIIFKSKSEYTRLLEDYLPNKDIASLEDRIIDQDQLSEIANRLVSKIDSFGLLLRKKTRNIALESIYCKLNEESI